MTVQRKNHILVQHIQHFLSNKKTAYNKFNLKSRAVTSERIQLYWTTSKSFIEKLEQEVWRAQILEKLCKDVQDAIPRHSRFFTSNYRYYKVQQAVGLLDAKVSQTVR